MSKIAQLIGVDERQWQRFTDIAHDTIGATPHDVDILSEQIQAAAHVMQRLGLDPRDTNPKELYHALRGALDSQANMVLTKLHVGDESDVRHVHSTIESWFNHTVKDDECYAIKTSVLKSIVAKNPPRELMRLLHFRSANSLIKRMNIDVVVTLARYTETTNWIEQYTEQLSRLHPSDFETRNYKLCHIENAELTQALDRTLHRHHMVLHAKEVGCIVLVPPVHTHTRHVVLRTFVLVAHYLQELKYFSAYTKTLLSDTNFSRRYIDGLIHSHESHSHLANIPFHWRALHRAVNNIQLHDTFAPHFSRTDWRVVPANDVIVHPDKHKNIWVGNGHVFYGHPPSNVSLNIIDHAIDASYGVSYEKRSQKFAQRELRQEVFSRYLGEPRILAVIRRRLDV